MREGEEGKANVLVIGAESVFGRHLMERLVKDGGYNVHCLDSYIPYPEDRSGEVCSYIQADICSYEDMRLCARGMEAVFHAGSFTPQHILKKKTDLHLHNVTGTENIVRVCRECKVKRLIYTSSSKVVVGKKWKQQQASENVPYPKSHQNACLSSLAVAEQLVLNSSGKDGFVTCAMRMAPVTFSEDDQLMDSLLNHSAVLVKNSYHGVTVGGAESSAGAHVLAEKKLRSGANSVAAGKAYNLGGKTRVLYRDLVGTLASDDETIWGQEPPTEVSRVFLTLLAYVNHYCYKMTGACLVSKVLSPLTLDTHVTELSFSPVRARHDLGWEEVGDWQTMVAGLVQSHRARQETKKEQ